MENKQRNYGFRNEPIIKGKDWEFFGGLSGYNNRPIILPSGDWRIYKPEKEAQRMSDGDTWACLQYY